MAYSMNPPSESSGLVQYMSSYVPGLYINGALTPVGLAIAISFMGLFVLVNYFGVVIFSKIINAITALKLVVPTITMVTLFLVSFKLRNFSAYGVAPYGPFSVVSAIVTSGIVYSYLGFQAVINLAGESRNPKRDGPLSLILVIIFSVVFYVVLQIAFIGSVPASDISKGWAFLSLPSPFADIAVSFNMFWLYTLIIADSIYSPSGSSMAAVASNSRNLYALSKNGTLPSFFLRVDNNTGIPRRALLFNFVISLIVLVTLKSWHQIIETLGILLLISFIGSAVSSGVIGSIKRYSSIKMPFIVIVSAIVFVFSGLIISISSFSKVLVVSLLLVPSLLLFAVSSGRGNRVIADVKAGLWFIIYVMEIAILSFIYNEHYVSGYIFLGAYLLSSTITFILARRSGVKFMHQAGEYDIAEIP
nr:APC family permease [Thermoplasma volcanium]